MPYRVRKNLLLSLPFSLSLFLPLSPYTYTYIYIYIYEGRPKRLHPDSRLVILLSFLYRPYQYKLRQKSE